MKNRILKTLTISIICATICNNANASGFGVDLHSTAGLANSYAGSAAGAHDVSDSFVNPANLSNVKSNSLSFGIAHLNSDIDDDNGSATEPGKAGGGTVSGVRNNDAGDDKALVPNFYFAHRINDKVVTGFNINSPYALSSKYDAGWIGRYHAIESKIKSVNFNPNISYEIDEKLAIGFGLQAQYVKTTLTKAIPTGGADIFGKLTADDFGYGYNLGATYKISEDAKIGIGYRSKIDHKLRGRSVVPAAGLGSNITTNITTPESLTIGGSYKINDKLEILSDIVWTRWSRVQAFDVIAPQSADLDADDLTFALDDTFKYAIGLNYQLNNQFKIRTGAAYEEGAYSSSNFRSPRLPTGDRIWTTLGFEYKISDDLKIDAAYLHQFYKKTSTTIEQTNDIGGLNTNYKLNVNIYSLGFVWDF